MNSPSRPLAVALCLLSTVAFGCSPSGFGSPQNYDTPEACFAGAKEAVANRDPLAFCDCLTDESQQMVAGAMVVMGGMMKKMGGVALLGGRQAAEEARRQFAPINDVLQRHGVAAAQLDDVVVIALREKKAEVLTQAGKTIADKRLFIAEMMGALSTTDRDVGFVDEITKAFAGDLKDLKINGDRATATLVGPTKRQPIEFRKSTAGWKIHIGADDLTPAPHAAESADDAR
jgi:hypothetical protein